MRTIYDPKQVLSKAAITSGSFTAGIGLSEEEADQFIDFVIDESGLKDRVRLVRMTKQSQKIDVLGLGSKVLKPATAAVDPGETVSINTRQIELNSKEMIAIVRISDDALEDNIQGDAFADHLLGMIARAAANEFEDALIYGIKLNAGTATEITQLWDGWLKLIRDNGGHFVDAAGAGFGDRFFDKEKMSKLVKSLPTKYRGNKRNLRAIMADDIDQDWVDNVLSGRATALGDTALQDDNSNRYRGIMFAPSGLVRTDRPVLVAGGGSQVLSDEEPVGETVLAMAATTNFAANDFVVVGRDTGTEEVAQIDSVNGGVSITLKAPGLQFLQPAAGTVEEVTADGTEVIMTHYQNLILGFQREMRIEPDRLPRLRATDWVVTMRAVPEIEEADAAAVLENLESK